MHDGTMLRGIKLACAIALTALVPAGASADGPGQPDQVRPAIQKKGRRAMLRAKPGERTTLQSADQMVVLRIGERALSRPTRVSIQEVSGHADRNLRSITYELGLAVRRFAAPVQVCFSVAARTRRGENLCLGYYDEATNAWSCEDTCLVPEKSPHPRKELLCGSTDHFTNFAILLAPSSDDESKCAVTEEDLPIPTTWGGTGT